MVKTHTFNGKKYRILFHTKIYGVCDYETRTLDIMKGNSLDALGSALEEALHAMGVPDEYLHKKNVAPGQSMSKVDDLARFLWRLGYRIKRKPKPKTERKTKCRRK